MVHWNAHHCFLCFKFVIAQRSGTCNLCFLAAAHHHHAFILLPSDFIQSNKDMSIHETSASRCQVAWLTPSEIFSPQYGAAFAAYCVAHSWQQRDEGGLQIVELGGGTGQFAKDFLDHVRQVCPNLIRVHLYVFSSTVHKINLPGMRLHPKCDFTTIGPLLMLQSWCIVGEGDLVQCQDCLGFFCM